MLHYILKSTNILWYLKENAPWQVVQLREDLSEERPLDRMNYDHVAVS